MTVTGLAGIGTLKLILYHFFVKKMAMLSFFSFILSKISFLTSTLIALKQFFSHGTHNDRSESHKLEVVHIPIKKFQSHSADRDRYQTEESKLSSLSLPLSSVSLTTTTKKPYPEMFFRDEQFNPYYQFSPQNNNKFMHDYKFI